MAFGKDKKKKEKKPLFSSKEITLRKKQKVITENQIPVKRTINLAANRESYVNRKVMAPAVAIIIICMVLVGKFAIVDRLLEVTRAQDEVADMQQDITLGYQKIASYGDITTKYAHYTYADMTADELNLVDRVEVTDMLNRVVFGKTKIGAWTLEGNQLNIVISGTTLRKINSVAKDLEKESIVSYCTVTTAATNSATGTTVTSANLDSPVTAQINVFLTKDKGE